MIIQSSITLKQSDIPGRVPTTEQLQLGEIGINTNDGLAYIKKSTSGVETIIPLGGVTASYALFAISSSYATLSGNTLNFISSSYYVPYTGATSDINLGPHSIFIGEDQYFTATADFALSYQDPQTFAVYNQIAGVLDINSHGVLGTQGGVTNLLIANSTFYSYIFANKQRYEDKSSSFVLDIKAPTTILGSSKIILWPDSEGTVLLTTSTASLAISASYATTASYALNSNSSSYALTASYALNTISPINGTGFVKASGTILSYIIDVITGSSSANNLAKFTGLNSITGSLIYDNGTQVAIGDKVSTNLSRVLRTLNLLGTDAVLRIGRFTDTPLTAAPSVELISYSNDGVYQKFWWDFFVNGDDTFNIRQRLQGGGATTNGTDITSTGIRMTISPSGSVSIYNNLTGTSATFSGTITSTSGNNTRLFESTSATTGYQYIRVVNTTGELRIGLEGSSGGSLSVGSLPYATILGSAGNKATQLIANNNVGLTLLENGNIGIGTASPISISSGYTTTDIRGSNGSGLVLGIAGSTTSRVQIYADAATTDFFGEGSRTMRFYSNSTLALSIASDHAATFTSLITSLAPVNEGFRIASNNGFYSGYNSTNTVRTGYLQFNTTGVSLVNELNTSMIFLTNNTTALVLTSNQQALFTNNTPSDWGMKVTNSSATAPYGLLVKNTTVQNNGTQVLIGGEEGANSRFYVYTNGGIANYSANNVNLSDERVKKNIVKANSYWDIIKAIEFNNYQYIEQDKSDTRNLLGVIAQQVEIVNSEWVSNNEIFGKDIDETNFKSVYEQQLQYGVNIVVQEAMKRIEQLENRLNNYE